MSKQYATPGQLFKELEAFRQLGLDPSRISEIIDGKAYDNIDLEKDAIGQTVKNGDFAIAAFENDLCFVQITNIEKDSKNVTFKRFHLDQNGHITFPDEKDEPVHLHGFLPEIIKIQPGMFDSLFEDIERHLIVENL